MKNLTKFALFGVVAALCLSCGHDEKCNRKAKATKTKSGKSCRSCRSCRTSIEYTISNDRVA